MTSAYDLIPYTPAWRRRVIDLSLRAWAPVFEKMRASVQDYVYDAFYPNGGNARQAVDVAAILDTHADDASLAVDSDALLGWVCIRIHEEDRMGEVHIIAVDPSAQRRGVGAALINHALTRIKDAGMVMAMVETGGDPGHEPSRELYESTGFDRWPVARYFRKL